MLSLPAQNLFVKCPKCVAQKALISGLAVHECYQRIQDGGQGSGSGDILVCKGVPEGECFCSFKRVALNSQMATRQNDEKFAPSIRIYLYI